jgi:uncharacterized protein
LGTDRDERRKELLLDANSEKNFSDFAGTKSVFIPQKSTMIRIGLISDTHSHLDPTVAQHFAECDEIWHAGDIGELSVIKQLQAIKPVRAVFGNIDDKEMQARFPEDLWMTVEGLTIWMTHIGGTPPNYNPRVKKILKEKTPDIFICGHSHILKIMRDTSRNLLYLNPGAAGNHGFHHMKTLIRFTLAAGKIENMEVVELGKRGKI